MRFCFLVFLFCANFAGAETSAPFRLSMMDAPKNLDPHRSRSSSGSFLLQQLYRNFFVLDDKNSYVPELGEKCVTGKSKRSKLKWTCTLKKDLKWSDGSALTAEDFVLSARRILTLPSPRADLLFNIQNARAVFEKKKKPEELGIKVVDSRTFEITWLNSSPDQNIFLMSPLFTPLPKGEFKKIYSGPYLLKSKNSQQVLLEPNPAYFKKNSRPPVEFQIFEENLAVKAFEKKQIDFLRRVPTAQIAQFEKSPSFHWYPVLRLDSIAFGPELKDQPEVRKRLTESLNFSELQELFHSPGKVGCPGLSPEMFDEICYRGNQNFVATKKLRPYKFVFSSAGGDDHRRLAEWLQSQWLKKLNLNLALQPLENKIFQDLLEKNPPALYRRGINLEGPSCFNGLQLFTQNHPDNFLGFKNAEYDTIVAELQNTSSDKQSKKLCTQALKVLMDSYVFIPTGRIHFAILANPQWVGWRLNQLNHLDLSELSFR